MNTQMERARGHTPHEEDAHMHDQDVGIQTGHNDEGHGDKKSMMNKVKAKAKKIKNSIVEHVGHGHEVHGHDHDHDEVDDEEDEMDTDPETHNTQSSRPGEVGVTKQHEPRLRDRTAAEGVPASKPGDYQNLDWTKTDTGRPIESTEQPYASKNTPVVGTERPIGMEKDTRVPKAVGEAHHPTSYQAKVTDPTSTAAQSFSPGEVGVTKQHEPRLGDRTTAEGVPVSKPSDHQTLDWMRTDTERPIESTEQPYASKNTLVVSTERPIGMEKDTQVPKAVGEDRHPASYQDKDPKSTAAQSFRPGEVGVTKQHEPRLGERTVGEDVPVSKPSDYQTLDWTRGDTGRPIESKEQPYASKNTHVVGTERPMGMEIDTQVLKAVAEARRPASYQAQVAEPTSTGTTDGAGAKERNTGKLGGILETPPPLEKDPHSPKGLGERRYPENYESKGGEETGVTPILHQLDKMNIYQEPEQEPNVRNGQEESMFKPKHSPHGQKISTGSHNQFTPEPITSETSKFLQTPESESHISGHEGSHEKPEQQGSYTQQISSAAAMMADKAKQATSSVTSKLGYGGKSDQCPTTTASSGLHGKQPETGGYVEKVSTATNVVADKAVQAKDVVATKLGYGGTLEGKPVPEETSKGGSVIETVKGTIAPVYNKVAEVGSTVASKVQGSGTEREVGPDTAAGPTDEADKGVSMKKYLVEKLKPGEEDKALSNVITEALPLHKHKEHVSKVEEEGEGERMNIKGKVTESEEVATKLGKSEDASYDHAKGVIDRIKDAFGYQKSGETPATDTVEGYNKGSSSISSKEDEQKRE